MTVHCGAILSEKSPKDLVGDLDPGIVDRVEVVKEFEGDEIGEYFETLLWSSTVEQQGADYVSHPLNVTDVGTHVTEGNQDFAQRL